MKQNDKTSRNKNQPAGHIDKPNRRIVTLTLFAFLPVFLFMVVATLVLLIEQEKLEMKVYLSTEKSIVKSNQINIETEIKHVSNDLLILTLNSQINKFCEDVTDIEVIEALTKDFLNVVEYRKIYDQGRLIDENGMEIIRVNFNNGNPIVIPQEKLQNKKDRYYFSEALMLNEYEIFVSPIDLNIENGKIEQPLKPMIRFATPFFDNHGEKHGIIVLNYLGQTIISQLDKLSNSMIESQIMLVNSNGYWLKGPLPENEWGFMYEDKKI